MVNFNQNLEKLLLLWNGVPSLMFLHRESCVNSIHSIVFLQQWWLMEHLISSLT